ncbi:MAG: mechanosensitive ion channel family protein [Tenericutes bacterium]|nr:mechanosensitive ion channel family protein [Mycoplasmatota bacterium]MDD6264322.1 mechanosensitive ion channel family protein [bacterium]MDY5993188.1 mechanosensitive ion channel family protein [Bacilli bacterium]
MKLYEEICSTLAKATTLDEKYIVLLLTSLVVIFIFRILKVLGKKVIQKITTGRREFVSNQAYQVTLNILEILVFIFLFDDYIKGLMTFISVISAAMTIALRDFILNFFCGIYIKFKKPFKVEDRIQIEDTKGDVMSISAFSFEILEVSTKEDNGQSTGIVIHYPNSIIVSKPVKNINKGFKYIWDEIVVKISLEADLENDKKEIYKIVNSLDTIKSIPKKMKNLINDVNTTNRIYFNKFDPIIYTKIVDDHVELNVRFLMHPKKARYIESVIWDKIYLAYKAKKINLYTGD